MTFFNPNKPLKESCVLGNSISYEELNKGKHYKSCKCDNRGFRCLNCGEYSCFSCVRSILKKVHEKCNNAAVDDEVCGLYRKFLEDPQTRPRTCHACRFGGRAQAKEEHLKMLELNKKPQIGTGIMYCHQFGFATDAPNGHNGRVDVHGMGPEKPLGIEAVWHEVSTPEAGYRNFLNGIAPKTLPQFGHTNGNVTRYLPVKVELTDFCDKKRTREVSFFFGLSSLFAR